MASHAVEKKRESVKTKPMLRSYLHLRRLQLLVHLQRVVMEPHLHKHLRNQKSNKANNTISTDVSTKTEPSSVSTAANTAHTTF